LFSSRLAGSSSPPFVGFHCQTVIGAFIRLIFRDNNIQVGNRNKRGVIITKGPAAGESKKSRFIWERVFRLSLLPFLSTEENVNIYKYLHGETCANPAFKKKG
jgi:hypothetical protein